MKKLIYMLAITMVIIPNIVKADNNNGEGVNTIENIQIKDTQLSAIEWLNNNTNYICTNGLNCSFFEAEQELINYYNTNLKNNYPYWTISILYGTRENDNVGRVKLDAYENNEMNFDYFAYPYIWYKNEDHKVVTHYNPNNQNEWSITETENDYLAIFGGYQTPNQEIFTEIYILWDSNFNIISEREYEIENFYNNGSNIIINIGDKFPLIKNLVDYSNWNDYVNNHLENYRTVDLNNYDYVLLTLKDYNQKEEFQTNLQVLGQIGITPIYNYGQTSKDAITGVRVQDRCNVSYNQYTTYPLYVLKQDLQNNVVYAVKSCNNNSKFKFPEDIFNITYVTAQNREDPIVTINGQQYHTIPLSELPSTANKNEEENYIPGQSGSMNDTGGLDGAIKGIQQKMGEIWDTFTYFTQFINQIFSVLPQELRIVLVSGFTIMIVLGLIKIFIN